MKQLTQRLVWISTGISPFVAAAVCSHGDVLYDTTTMTDELTYNHSVASYIGGLADQCCLTDVQAADDFVLDDAHTITGVTADYLTVLKNAFPAAGVLVEFFEDLDGAPSEIPFAATLTTAVSSESFENVLWEGGGVRLIVDLTDDGITLDAGSWWVSIVPVDETPEGARYTKVRTTDFLVGNRLHARDGGIDHGTGYDGNWGVDDWTLLEVIGHPAGDFAMKIEGDPVGSAADLDGDGIVGTPDLLILLGAWGDCPGKGDCPADIDGDGTVGTSDLLILLGSWG